MRSRHLAWFGSLSLLALSCGGEGDTPAAAEGTCEDALARLQGCVDAHCAQTDSNTCASFRQAGSGSLFGASSDPCASMTDDQVDHLLSESCEALLAEAGLVLDGKADGECPPYFPWCEEAAGEATGYSVDVVSFDAGSITLDVTVHDVGYESVVMNGEAFHELTLDAAGRVPEVGKPHVPAVGLMIGVPGGTDTAWVEHFEVRERATLSNLRLAPLQQMTVEDEPPADFAYDAAAYAVDAPYPGYEHAMGSIATWRNYRVVRLDTFPVQYNAASGDLEVATRFTVVVRFDDQQAEPIDTVDGGEEAFAEAYDDTLVNYYEASDGDEASAPAPDPDRTRYLFVVHDPLVGAIEPLVQQKETEGFKTEVVLTGSLTGEGDLAERIKNAIRARYEQDAVEYVLLVGEHEDIPLYTWSGKPSDVWYGCLAGDDVLPEVSVGRMLGKTPEELSVHVTKTLGYLSATSAGQELDWRNRVLLVAHEQQYPKKYTECLESVREANYRSGTVRFEKLYGGEEATNEQVVARLNEGVGILNYRGHGSETAWHEWNGHDFNVDEADLRNADRLPVIFSIACLNSAYQTEKRTMAEQWVLREGGGAVAVLGATRPSYTKINHDFNRYLFQAILVEGVEPIGLILGRATAKLFNQYGTDWMAQANMRMYTWLGDPSLRIGQVFDVDPPPPPPGAVIVNEVMADPPDNADGDTNGDGVRNYKDDEFVELVNTGAGATDVSGWTIVDRVGVRYTFPDGTVIPPGKALVVFGGGTADQFADMGGSQVLVASSGLRLNNKGDAITLVDAEGERVDGLEYKASLADGASMVRAVDGDGASSFERHPGEPPYSPGRKRDGGVF